MFVCVAIIWNEASTSEVLTAGLMLCKEAPELCHSYHVPRRSQIPWAEVKVSSWTIPFPLLTHTQLYFWCTYEFLYSHFWGNLPFKWVEFQVGRSLSLCWQAKPSPVFTLTCSVHESPWSLAFFYVNSESSPGTPSPAQFSPAQRITSGDNLRWSLNCTVQTSASLQIHLCLGIHLWE